MLMKIFEEEKNLMANRRYKNNRQPQNDLHIKSHLKQKTNWRTDRKKQQEQQQQRLHIHTYVSINKNLLNKTNKKHN